jgi:hypothetical protein
MRQQDYEGSRQLGVYTMEHQKGFCNLRRRVGDYSPLQRWKEAVVGGNRRLRSHQQRQACNETPASRNSRQSRYVWAPITSGLPTGEAHLREQEAWSRVSTSQSKTTETRMDNRISSLRSIGALAFAEVQKRGENNKTTRANKRGTTGREQKNGPEEETPQAQRHLSCVPHLHACEAQSRLREKGPSGGLG